VAAMKFIKKFDHYITAIFVITIVVIIATSYFTFKEFFNASNQKQQEVVMPLFSLINSEIIRPLTVSQYMANDPFLLDYIEQETIGKEVILNYLTSVSNQRF
jgi:NADH:ubiquinone oxidoreductase subunit 6 (subunit J)